MAAFKTLAFMFFLCFASISGDGNGNSSFLFNGFNKDIVLFRDSKLVNGGSLIQLTNSMSGSEGRVIYKKPIKLFEGKSRNFSRSFSTHFEFSMSKEIGSVLSFVMVPSGLDLRVFDRKDNETSSGLGFVLDKEVVAIEFGISKRGNRVGILVGRPEVTKIRKLTSFGHHFKRLNCWIDYEASSKRIEVRLSVSKGLKPVDPFVSYLVDLVKVWRDREFMVGLVSKNGNSSKSNYLHSWKFAMRHVPVRIHSQPLDPNVGLETVKEKKKTVVKEGKGKAKAKEKAKGKCVWKMLGTLVLGAVCGTLGAMLALYLWTVCGNRQSIAIVPEECANIKEKSDEESKK